MGLVVKYRFRLKLKLKLLKSSIRGKPLVVEKLIIRGIGSNKFVIGINCAILGMKSGWRFNRNLSENIDFPQNNSYNFCKIIALKAGKYMVSILHISDFHIIKGPEWNNMRAALLDEVKEKVHNQPKGEKLLIITGDFHNFNDKDYQYAEDFLRQMIDAMALDPDKDVFVIPGNHDVGNTNAMNAHFGTEKEWIIRQKSALTGIKNDDRDYMEWRLESFIPYCEFVRELGIYPADSQTLPAEVHVRNWRGKLNILHLNTALVADGTAKDEQMVDTYTATDDEIWKPYFESTIPALALGHNSFFDLKQNQQVQLEAIFERKNVSAYLCGDKHKHEADRDKQMIRLKAGIQGVPEIPNIVCMKGAADGSDNYSEFGFYWHNWDEQTDEVVLEARNWKRDEEQSEFALVKEDSYVMRREKNESTTPPPPSTNILAASLAATDKETLKLSADKRTVRDAYFDYLSKELGVIQFDGIPTDKDSGTVKAELERVFVPLEFHRIAKEGEEENQLNESGGSIKEVLTSGKRVAILAKPGGGKSTLIRRIALAYAYPERKAKVDDGLPDAEWFPIYIRCRDLGENVQKSITEIIFSIVSRAELSQYRIAFETLVEEQLKIGQVLLLIDGLDEISNEQYRVQFVNQLHTFVNTNSTVHLLITSRETGFRAVAQKLSSYCNQYVIADLNEVRICQLSENWHKALLDNQSQAKADSDNVCKIILQDPRITALARNPLLLTTLLFVKRWIGYLPTKKCQLYQEMIKLLLVSWNAVAHLRMDMDETEPQLAFVAYRMTKEGKQTITKEELIQCIADARKALPELLGYTKVSPAEFIDQVEARSSILIQQGLEEDDRGNLVQSYEFSHLSFQEYLTAKAISENWLPENEQTDPISTYLTILKEHCNENQWWEVIPLTAVLLKRHAKPAMEYLLSMCKNIPEKQLPEPERRRTKVAAFHLANCIAYEVPLATEILEPALLAIANQSYAIENVNRGRFRDGFDANIDKSSTDVFKTIYHSEKYGKSLKSIVENELLEKKDCLCVSGLANVWLKIYCEENGNPSLKTIVQLLNSPERKKYIFGALLMVEWSFKHRLLIKKKKMKPKAKQLNVVFSSIQAMLSKENIVECFAAAWCIAWSGYSEADIIPSGIAQSIAAQLLHLWCTISEPYDLRRALSWAICTVSRRDLNVERTSALSEAIAAHMEHPENEYDRKAALILQLLLNEITIEDVKKMGGNLKLGLRGNRYLEEMGLKHG